VFDILESEDFFDANIYMQPPSNGQLSDEDSDDEEGTNSQHLSASQLMAPADFRIDFGSYVADSFEVAETVDDDVEVAEPVDVSEYVEDAEVEREIPENEEETTAHPLLNEKWLSRQKPPQRTNNWNKKSISDKNFDSVLMPQPARQDIVTPVALFEKFFDDEVIEFIVKMTKLYAQRDKGKHGFNTDSQEIRLFLGMLILTGYNQLPRRKLYWENSEDVHNPAMSNSMSRNRFEELLSVLHFSDNMKLDKEDKMTKIRPLYNMIRKRCVENRPNAADLSVDESMLPYYGRNSSKQRMQNKPVRSGYKMWVLAEPLGYVVNFDPYQGAKSRGSVRANENNWGLGETVVLSLMDVLPSDTCYRVFMDNFFTSFRLLQFLAKNNIRASGTVRENRLGDCTIPKKKLVDKLERGGMKYRTSEQSNLTVVAWKDNKSVYVASNCDSVQPLSQVQRWNKENKRK